jgi:hypothetical protein
MYWQYVVLLAEVCHSAKRQLLAVGRGHWAEVGRSQRESYLYYHQIAYV